MTRVLAIAVAVSLAMVSSAWADDTPVPGAPPAVDVSGVARRVMTLWSPNCDAAGANRTRIVLSFKLSANGRISQGPDWTNPSTDEASVSAASRAKAAVVRGQPYDGLPDALYGQSIVLVFDAAAACGAR